MPIDAYLKIKEAKGEATNPNFKDQIVLQHFSWGAEQVSSVGGQSGGSGVGKAHLHPITFTHAVDKSSGPMFKALTSGTHFDEATLSAVKAGSSKPYLVVELKKVFISSLQFSATDDLPLETVTLTYGAITIEYSVQDDKGVTTSAGKHGFNLQTLQPI
jgi:type VI secretion system secreted protein Hcp